MDANDRSITLLAALSHGMVHTYELSVPIFVTVWLETFSTSRAALGVLTMIGYGLFGLGGIPAGLVADRYNPRVLLLLALGGMSLSFLLIGLAPNLVLLGLAFALWGIAASIHHPSSLSLISRSVKARGRGLAYHGMAGNFGIAVGPLLTSLMLTFLHWRTVAFLLAVPALLISLLGTRFSFDRGFRGEESSTGEAPNITSFRNFFRRSRGLFTPSFSLLILVVIFTGLYYRGILTFLPDFFARLPQIPSLTFRGISFEGGRYLYSGLLILGMLGQYVGGRLSDHFDSLTCLLTVRSTQTLLAFAFIPVEYYPFPLLVGLGGIMILVLFSAQPLRQAAIADFSPDENRGLAYGYNFFGTFGVGAIGAGLSGVILFYSSTVVLFTTLAMILLPAVMMLLFIKVLRSPGNISQKEEVKPSSSQ